jgi:hypothetical protein
MIDPFTARRLASNYAAIIGDALYWILPLSACSRKILPWFRAKRTASTLD